MARHLLLTVVPYFMFVEFSIYVSHSQCSDCLSITTVYLRYVVQSSSSALLCEWDVMISWYFVFTLFSGSNMYPKSIICAASILQVETLPNEWALQRPFLGVRFVNALNFVSTTAASRNIDNYWHKNAKDCQYIFVKNIAKYLFRKTRRIEYVNGVFELKNTRIHALHANA